MLLYAYWSPGLIILWSAINLFCRKKCGFLKYTCKKKNKEVIDCITSLNSLHLLAIFSWLFNFMSQTLNERFDLTASIMTSSLLESVFFYENLAFSARSCGSFLFTNSVPLTLLSSYHHLKKCCHTGKQALSWLAWYSSI